MNVLYSKKSNEFHTGSLGPLLCFDAKNGSPRFHRFKDFHLRMPRITTDFTMANVKSILLLENLISYTLSLVSIILSRFSHFVSPDEEVDSSQIQTDLS
jgi:hypothetical protein